MAGQGTGNHMVDGPFIPRKPLIPSLAPDKKPHNARNNPW